MGPIETSKSGANHAVLNSQNDRLYLGSRETSFMVLITLIYMHKTTGEVWVPYRLVILLQKSLFCMQKPQKRAGTHRDK